MGYMERKDASGVLDKPELPAEMVKMLSDVKAAVQAMDSKSEDTKRNATEALLKYEESNVKYVKDLADYKKALDENTKRLKDLETGLATQAHGTKADDGRNGEWKSFFDWTSARPGTSELRSVMERKDAGTMLRTDNMQAGGYLVPPMTDGLIRKKVVEMSPVRSFATNRTMPSKTLSMPIRKSLLDSYFEGEAEANPESESKYGEETVTAWRHGVKVRLTYDQLVMSPFNMEAEISADVGQSFAKKEGYMFLKGTGNKQPFGFMAHPEVASIATNAVQKVDFDDIANLIGSLKTGYNPYLFFNRITLAKLFQVKDLAGRPLWSPAAGDKPSTIWDQPYTSTFIDMDSLAGTGTTNAVSGSVPIIYADLKQAYEIFDVVGMNVIRDDVTQADKSIIIYNFRRWLTAKTIMPEAIKLLKVK